MAWRCRGADFRQKEPFMKTADIDDEDDIWVRDRLGRKTNVVRDGGVVRVRLGDSKLRAVTREGRRALQDSHDSRNYSSGLNNSNHQPPQQRPRSILDAGLDAATLDAYRQYDLDAQSAWMGHNPPVRTHDAREGDVCMTDDKRPGHVHNGRCVADEATDDGRRRKQKRDPQGREQGTEEWEEDSRSLDQMLRDHERTMAKIYSDYDERASNSWRQGK
jgi:hypothetical protein